MSTLYSPEPYKPDPTNWKNFFTGKSPSIVERPLYDPQQMGMLEAFLNRGGDTVNKTLDYYNSILSGDQNYFDMIENPIRRNFENKTVPAIMNQVGQTAGLRSSALGQQLGEAGTDLDAHLGALRGIRQDSAAAGLQNLMKFGMTPTKQHFNLKGSQGFLEMLPYYIAMAAGGRQR